MDVRPDRLKQLLLLDDPVPVLDQADEGVEELRPNAQDLAAMVKLAALRIQAKGAELEHFQSLRIRFEKILEKLMGIRKTRAAIDGHYA
jgi:hypothetical protein